MQPRSARGILLSLFVVALIVRVLFVFVHPHFPLTDDAIEYWGLGERLVSQGRLVTDDGWPAANREPAYPLLLAGIRLLFGDSLLAVRLVQSLLSALAVVPVWYLVRHIGGARAAAIAGLGVALHPVLIAQTGLILTESLMTLLVAGTVLFWLHVRQREDEPGMAGYAMLGLCLGLLVLVRSEFVFLPAVVILVDRRGSLVSRQTLGVAAVVLLCAAVVVGPWVARNYYHYGRIFLTHQTWITLWLGTHPAHLTEQDPSVEPLNLFESGRYTPSERSDLFRNAAIENFTNYPLTYVKLSFVRVWWLLGSGNSYIINGLDRAFFHYWDQGAWGKVAVKGLLWSLNLVLVLAALATAIAYRRTEGVMVISAVIAYKIATHMLSFAQARHEIPLIPLFVALAVIGWSRFLHGAEEDWL